MTYTLLSSNLIRLRKIYNSLSEQQRNYAFIIRRTIYKIDSELKEFDKQIGTSSFHNPYYN